MIEPNDRARILTQLAFEQDRQRQERVTELADICARITQLRRDLKVSEQSYRAAYRRTLTSGLLTGQQLRALGLPPMGARRRGNQAATPAEEDLHSQPNCAIESTDDRL